MGQIIPVRPVTNTLSKPLITMHSLKWVMSEAPLHGIHHLRSENPSGLRQRFLNMKAEITSPTDDISPSSASVALGATQQFASSVGTVWVAAYGTVSGNGLYTAPDSMPPSHTDTVLVAGEGGAACANIHLLPALPITVAWRGNATANGNSYRDNQGERSSEQDGLFPPA
jgi:hypothetical protein